MLHLYAQRAGTLAAVVLIILVVVFAAVLVR